MGLPFSYPEPKTKYQRQKPKTMCDRTLKSIEHPKHKLRSFVHTALINLFPETLRSRHLICILQYRPIWMQQSQTITYDNSSVTSTVHLFPSHHQKTCYNSHKSSYLDKHHRFPYTSVKKKAHPNQLKIKRQTYNPTPFVFYIFTFRDWLIAPKGC